MISVRSETKYEIDVNHNKPGEDFVSISGTYYEGSDVLKDFDLYYTINDKIITIDHLNQLYASLGQFIDQLDKLIKRKE